MSSRNGVIAENHCNHAYRSEVTKKKRESEAHAAFYLISYFFR